MEKNYVAPSIELTAFHCPRCGTKVPQIWLNCYGIRVENKPCLYNIKNTEEFIKNYPSSIQKELPNELAKKFREEAKEAEAGGFNLSELKDSVYCTHSFGNIFFSVCQEESCGKASLWIHDKLIIPTSFIEEPPNEDMPDDIKAIYNEARAIHGDSPRASAALLRLCCEMLCDSLEAKGKTLNDKIGDLVKRGMDEHIQEALDILRFIGNKAVHPGQIDLKDDLNTSHSLFILINEITQEMISKPKRLKNIYNNKLPENVREEIKKRDNIKK